VQSARKAVSKFELPETQFERTVRDKIACQTYLKRENYCFEHIFGIPVKFAIRYPKKTLQNFVESGKKAVLKFEMLETQLERTVRDKIASKTQIKL